MTSAPPPIAGAKKLHHSTLEGLDNHNHKQDHELKCKSDIRNTTLHDQAAAIVRYSFHLTLTFLLLRKVV